ncbi:MAG: nucleotidyltransferase domain-containing protein [Desulfuromonadaceae bacterium]|nr:nucleotidyltransferase domain-containing protein [Desulfuromonadaceae bacterium]
MNSQTQQILNNIQAVLNSMPQVEFAYLFGSQAQGVTGPLSDIDIAVFVQEREDMFMLRLLLLEQLQRLGGLVPVDLVVLNNAPPVLKYEVICNGNVIKENRELRVMFEVRTLGEYLDTQHLRNTQRPYLKRQLKQALQ